MQGTLIYASLYLGMNLYIIAYAVRNSKSMRLLQLLPIEKRYVKHRS